MLYYVAFGLAMVSATVGQRCEQTRADLPMNPGLLRVVSGLAGILATVLFVYGFWIAWYAPLIAIGCGLALTAAWAMIGQSNQSPLFSIVTGAASAVLCAILFIA